MDKMLQEADITPANLSRLSEGFKKLGTSGRQNLLMYLMW